MMLEIVRCNFADIENAQSFPALCEEYAEESSIDGMPPAKARLASYHHLEAVGTMQSIGAFLDGTLIGFILILVPVIPHYGIGVAVSESFFVAKQHRKCGAGTKLRQAAEQYAAEVKSPGFLISAPFGGVLEKVLKKSKYRQTNSVFFIRF